LATPVDHYEECSFGVPFRLLSGGTLNFEQN
jgi:hypothetical protein